MGTVKKSCWGGEKRRCPRLVRLDWGEEETIREKRDVGICLTYSFLPKVLGFAVSAILLHLETCLAREGLRDRE